MVTATLVLLPCSNLCFCDVTPKLDRRAISMNSGGMGFFRQTWAKVLIVVILVLVVGSTAVYLLGTRQNQPNTFSQPTPSLQAPIGTRFSPTIVQPFLTSLPTSSERFGYTTHWNTYVNKLYGFSIKYPPDYHLTGVCESCTNDSMAPSVQILPLQKDSPQFQAAGYGNILIGVQGAPVPNITTDQYAETIIHSYTLSNPLVPGSQKRFQLNDMEALAFTVQYPGGQTKYVFFLKSHRGHITTFSFSGDSSPANKGLALRDYKNLEVFDQILSTFQFTY